MAKEAVQDLEVATIDGKVKTGVGEDLQRANQDIEKLRAELERANQDIENLKAGAKEAGCFDDSGGMGGANVGGCKEDGTDMEDNIQVSREAGKIQEAIKSTPSKNGEALNIVRRYAAKRLASEGIGGESDETNGISTPSDAISPETWTWLKQEMMVKRGLTLEQAAEMVKNDASVKKLEKLDKTYLRNMKAWMGGGDDSDKKVEVWWKSESAQMIAMNGVSTMI